MYMLGGIPYRSLKAVEKLLGLVNPVKSATSAMVYRFFDNSSAACFSRMFRIKSRVVWLVSSFSLRCKCTRLMPTSGGNHLHGKVRVAQVFVDDPHDSFHQFVIGGLYFYWLYLIPLGLLSGIGIA